MRKVKVNFKFLLLLFSIAALTFYDSNRLTYTLLYITLAIFFISIIYSRNIYKNLLCNFNVRKNILSVGDNYNLELDIYGLQIFPILNLKVFSKELTILDKTLNPIDTTLMTSEFVTLPYNGVAKKRGIYILENTEFYFSDLFKIFKMHKVVSTNKSIKIYPRIYAINTFPMQSAKTLDSLTESLFGKKDSLSIKDIRKYVTGDSIKNIHWKLSAKHNELMVRTHSSVVGKELNIFVNMHKSNQLLDDEEKMVGFLASITKYMLDRDIKVNIYMNDSNISRFTLSSNEEFSVFMENLIVCESDGQEYYSSFIKNNIKNISKGSWAILLDINPNFDTSNAIINLRRLNYNILLITSQESSIEKAYLEKFYDLGVIISEIDDYILN